MKDDHYMQNGFETIRDTYIQYLCVMFTNIIDVSVSLLPCKNVYSDKYVLGDIHYLRYRLKKKYFYYTAFGCANNFLNSEIVKITFKKSSKGNQRKKLD